MAELHVRSGHVVALRLFDIAYAIDLGRVEDIWARHAGTASSRSRLSATPAKAVAFGVPPVALSLDAIPLNLGPIAATAAVTARIYDFGVVALALRVATVDLSWPDYTALLNAMDTHVGRRPAVGGPAGPGPHLAGGSAGAARPAPPSRRIT